MEVSAEKEYGGQTKADQTSMGVYRFADLSSYSLKDRWTIRVADLACYILIRVTGSTVRFEVEGWENWERVESSGHTPIYTFWHNRIFLSTYFWRGRGIIVMTSRSFDGEYIARFIQRFGYGAARGSSTRRSLAAIIEMIRLMKKGFPAAFTIDGPKGPRYVAKMGALLLAKKTGNPILPFTVTPARLWEVKKSWDLLQIPKPFTKALVKIAEPFFVASDLSEEDMKSRRDELQSVLDDIVRRGEEWRGPQV